MPNKKVVFDFKETKLRKPIKNFFTRTKMKFYSNLALGPKRFSFRPQKYSEISHACVRTV